MTPQDKNDGAPIRTISRAIAVLKAINRAGSANLTTIARDAGLPYATVVRLVDTLIHEGLIERERDRKYYRPTELVLTLSHGFQGHSRLVTGARPHMEALTHEILWPVSFATRIGHSMVVRDSTHSLSALTFNNYHPGFSMPILGCASGLVYIAFAPEAEREAILSGLQLDGAVAREVLLMFEKDYLPNKIRQDGHALIARNPHTLDPGKTSSIAVPLFKDTNLVGALTLVFFSASMKMTEAARRYLPALHRTAGNIQEEWSSPAQDA